MHPSYFHKSLDVQYVRFNNQEQYIVIRVGIDFLIYLLLNIYDQLGIDFICASIPT